MLSKSSMKFWKENIVGVAHSFLKEMISSDLKAAPCRVLPDPSLAQPCDSRREPACCQTAGEAGFQEIPGQRERESRSTPGKSRKGWAPSSRLPSPVRERAELSPQSQAPTLTWGMLHDGSRRLSAVEWALEIFWFRTPNFQMRK